MNGSELEALRKARGLSRADLAKELECTPGGLWSVEHDRDTREPGLKARVEAYFGSPVTSGRYELPVPVMASRPDWHAVAPWCGINPGDWITIHDVEGEFRFIRYVITERGNDWVDVVGGTPKHIRTRSFLPERVVGVEDCDPTDLLTEVYRG